jgi:hypothetical protein
MVKQMARMFSVITKGVALWAAGGFVFGFCPGIAPAGLIPVPNASFETPAATFVNINIDSWQKPPKPDSYEEDGGFFWDQLVGGFKNTPPGNFDHIDNCDGHKAIWIFAVTGVALFQDYDTVDWNDGTQPSHDFDAAYSVGSGYRLSFGILVGRDAGNPMQQGVTLDANLYYRDENSNRVAIATTTVTNLSTIFSNATHLMDFHVNVPAVQAGDAWAGKHIGIEFKSTIATNLTEGGYWDVDNVRLREFPPPQLTALVASPQGFELSVHSETGMVVEILASTNLLLPAPAWSSVGTVTNLDGVVSFTDVEPPATDKYYRARLVP